VGPRAGLDGCGKSRFESRTTQPIARRYTEYYEKSKNLASHTKFSGIDYLLGDRGNTVFKVLCYKSEGRWFDSKWCHWNFSLT